jgi:transcriptional regulator with GAF, ATPase, and Fis domain
VKRHVDLIDRFADLVVSADDPRILAERTLEVLMSLNRGRSGAVFAREGDTVTLFASRGIDQEVLDAVKTIWGRHRDALQNGQTFSIGNREEDRRLPRREPGGPASLVVMPVFSAGKLVALLYVDSFDPHFSDPNDMERMSRFSRIVAKAVTGIDPHREEARSSTERWETYLERTPVHDLEREKLLLLLNRNEWNIARVARLMGVTRRTIYLRLERYKIPRERVPKGRLRIVPQRA